MSEYQYYEFMAIDRPLDEKARQALRAMSTRAQITSTSFVNSYQWGSLKGDPTTMMAQWFDLHFYMANWGSRRLMIRVPKRLVDATLWQSLLIEVDCATLETVGDNLILDIQSETENGYEAWGDDEESDGSGWLAALAPLRGDIIAGDLRPFYLLWLTAVAAEVFEADEPEPLPGIGPLSGSLEALARLLGLDPDLVAAAAERPAATADNAASAGDERKLIAALPEAEKTALLERLFDGDPHVAVLLRRALAPAGQAPPDAALRKVGDLLARASAIRAARDEAKAQKRAAENKRKAEEAEKAQRLRLDQARKRGEKVWADIEADIELRNKPGYERAAGLLSDLAVIAREDGTSAVFERRLNSIRAQHSRKPSFIAMLAKIAP